MVNFFIFCKFCKNMSSRWTNGLDNMSSQGPESTFCKSGILKLKRLSLHNKLPLMLLPIPPISPKVKSFSSVRLFVTPWTVAYQVPSSMAFSRQEYWNRLPFPSPGNFPTQGSNLGLPHCRQMLYHLSHQGRP